MGACKDCGCKDGDRGPMGLPGEKGDTGASGLQGNPGQQGGQGFQGIQGVQGLKGDTGPAGAPGSGIGGTAGPTGPQGNPGPQGIPGNKGNNGQGRLNYVLNEAVAAGNYNAVLNEGIIMKNTNGVQTIIFPLGSVIGDIIQVVGTSYGTGGWRVSVQGTDTIQMTNQNPSYNTTTAGGFVTPATTNYRDVMTFLADGTGVWIVIDAIFANGNSPLFS